MYEVIITSRDILTHTLNVGNNYEQTVLLSDFNFYT